MKRYFITATGTDIGKTFVTAALTWQLRQKGLNVQALKPIASGVDEKALATSDAGQLLAALEKPLSDINTICPWRYRAPLSPDMAAKQEGIKYTFDELVAFCNTSAQADIQLIEGVGGVMSPVTAQHTVFDWINALALPVILVAGSYVGSISHTLSALAVIKPHAIIINETCGSVATLLDTKDALERHIQQKIPIRLLSRLDSKAEIWKDAANHLEGLI